MEINKNWLIKCPHCGCEYAPNEIFYPQEVFGNASNIIRDENGKIIFFEGQLLNLKEEYTCDHCNKTFIAEIEMTFKTTKPEIDFDEEF